MANSVFCLAPRGRAAWSPRLVEALHAGCIPVIVADKNYEPFQDVLDYSAFAVHVHDNEVQGTTRIVVRERGCVCVSVCVCAARTIPPVCLVHQSLGSFIQKQGMVQGKGGGAFRQNIIDTQATKEHSYTSLATISYNRHALLSIPGFHMLPPAPALHAPQVEFLKERLQGIDPGEVQRMLHNGVRARQVFRYPALGEGKHEGREALSAVTLAVFSAWRRTRAK